MILALLTSIILIIVFAWFYSMLVVEWPFLGRVDRLVFGTLAVLYPIGGLILVGLLL